MPYLMETCGECRYCRTGRESLCLDAGFISFRRSAATPRGSSCPAAQLVRVPDELSDEAAAALQIAFGTAWHMLFTRGQAPGRRDGADQLGRQRHRLGGRAAREARRRLRDRERRAATTSSRAPRSSAWTSASTTRRRTSSRRSWRRRTASGVDVVYEHVGGELFQKGLDSLAKDGAPRHLRRPRRARSSPSTSSRSSGAQKSVIGSFVYDAGRGREGARAGRARPDHAARRQDVPARSDEGGDGDDGEPGATSARSSSRRRATQKEIEG